MPRKSTAWPTRARRRRARSRSSTGLTRSRVCSRKSSSGPGLPYKVVGGVRFYERREVRDLLAYLRLIANPEDEVSLRRVLNTPRRGIGDRAEEYVAALASRDKISFAAALRRPDDVPGLATRSARAIEGFNDLITGLREMSEAGQPGRRHRRGRARPDGLCGRAAGLVRPAGRQPDREPDRARLGGPRVRRPQSRWHAGRIPRAGVAGRRCRSRSPRASSTAAWSR